MLPAVKKWLRRGIAVLASLALWLLLILGALLLIDGYATSIIRHEIALIRQKGEPVTLADIPDSKGNLHLEPQKQLISALQHASDVFNEVEEAFDYSLLISSGFEIGENGRMKFRDEVALLDDFANKPQYQSQYSKLLEAHKRIGKIETTAVSSILSDISGNQVENNAAALLLGYMRYNNVMLTLSLRQKNYQVASELIEKQVELISLVPERTLIESLIRQTVKGATTDLIAHALAEKDLPVETVRSLKSQCDRLSSLKSDLNVVYCNERAYDLENHLLLSQNEALEHLPSKPKNYFQFVLMKYQWASYLDSHREKIMPFVHQWVHGQSYKALCREKARILDELPSFETQDPFNQDGFFSVLLGSTLESYMENEAGVRLALTGCAVELFGKEKGRLPEKLEELVPEYLEQVPSDPFDGKPLCYAPREDGTFLLYSVGENLTDDGGNNRDRIWPQP